MKTGSRLVRHKERQSRKQALLYFVLSIIFVIGVVKLGVPGFIQLVSWFSGKDAPKQEVDLGVPPQAPVLGEVPEATFSSQIKLTGLAQTGMKIRLSVNGEAIDEVDVQSDGSFVFERVALIDGENRLEVVSIDEKNQESEVTSVIVVLDKEAPKLEIVEPANETVYSGSAQQTLVIKGKVESAEIEVRVNDNFVFVGSGSTFEYRTRMNEGVNELVIKAIDRAGNASEQLLRVTWTP